MIDKLFEKVAGAITHRPKLMLGLLILVFFVALYGMTQISMETGTATYLNKDSEKGILNDKYTATFQSDTLIFIIETSDPLDPNILAYVDELEANVRQQQNIKSVYSIVDILKSMNGGELPRTRAEVDAIVALIPPETRTTAVPSNVMSLVQIQLSEGLSEEARNGALDNVISVVDASSPPPGTKVTVTGSPAFAKEMSNALMSNMGVLIGGAMILMIVVMGILFAYVRYRFLPVVLVGAGLITSLGLMGLAGIQLNMAVVGAFPVLIGLGIDYAIQFHARFDEESRKGSLGDAVFMTVTRTGPAVMYAMLATCMGFLAMFISPVPMIRSFGLVSIIGVMCSYTLSLIGLPTIALLLNYTPKVQKTDSAMRLAKGHAIQSSKIHQNPYHPANRKKVPGPMAGSLQKHR